MADIIKVEHLSYIYNPGMPNAVTALDDVSFTVEEGDFEMCIRDRNYIEDFLCAVLNHPLEVRAVIRLGRIGTVNVGADHGDTVLLGVVLAVAQLPFNGRFALTVG